MDIEMAANLPSESQAKFAKGKSRGLTHTFVTETMMPYNVQCKYSYLYIVFQELQQHTIIHTKVTTADHV